MVIFSSDHRLLLIDSNHPFFHQQADFSYLMSEISKLKYELWTDKPLEKLQDSAEDAAMWNSVIESV